MKIKKERNTHKFLTRYKQYRTEELLEEAVYEYFEIADLQGKSYTMSGLKAHLGLSQLRYVNMLADPMFKETLEMAARAIEAATEEGYQDGSLNGNAANFTLKNHFGWSDKQTNININENKSVDVDKMKSLMDRDQMQKLLEVYHKAQISKP